MVDSGTNNIETQQYGHMVMPVYPPSWGPGIPIAQGSRPITVLPGSLADRWIRESRILGSTMPLSDMKDDKGVNLGDPGRVLGIDVLSVKKLDYLDSRRNPVYQITYRTVDKNGNNSGLRTTTVSELPKDQQQQAGGPPNTRFVRTLDLAPRPAAITTGSTANPPAPGTISQAQDKEWDQIIRLAIERGTPESAAKELAKLARSVGITDTSWAEKAGIIGPAVAKLFERNPLTVKKLYESEGRSLQDANQVVVGSADEDKEPFQPQETMADIINAIANALGGSGGAKRIYTPPDRREVEDMVRGMMARTIGLPVEADVQSLTDLYMREDRRAFDNPTGGISAQASVLARIRGRNDYKQIHKLRPDIEDEMDWLNKRYGAVQEGGLSGETAIESAIEQATVGATDEAAAEAGSNELVTEGSLSTNFRDRFTAIGRAMGSRLA